MLWDTTRIKQNKNILPSTEKSQSATDTLGALLRYLGRSIRAHQIKSDRKWQRFCREAGICAKCLSAILILLVFSQTDSFASISPTTAKDAIVAESASEGLRGMTAVAEVIRRRGHLKGLYGLRRKAFIQSQPKWVHDQAMRAWKESANTNLTKGATLYENIDDFGFPKKWDKSKVVKVAKIGKHTFYREIKKARKV